MKKIVLSLVFASVMTTMSAQTETLKSTDTLVETNFNKWSVELAGGFNKYQGSETSGYSTSLISPYVVDLGVRYMLNNKFGLKADFGYNSFTNEAVSKSFDTKYYRVDLQGVANLGRIMSFETWTKSIGLLGHAGVGLSFLERKYPSYKKDRMGNFMAGLTGQIKLSDRIALTGDFTTILNAKQDLAFDGASSTKISGFSGVLFNGTVGITVYLGKNAKHADWDWINGNKETEDKLKELERRIADLETLSNDTDRDGVVDYLDVEPNSIGGVMVDTKGRSIDNNNNGIPDELESYMVKKYGDPTTSSLKTSNESIKNLINNGYIATYFDFGKSAPTNVSTGGIDFILTYLKNNPSATVDIIGHADEIGKSAYNNKLSDARANSVKNTLVKAKIDPSRLNVIPAGEDTSVDKDSDIARRLVRRVTFRVK
ncbi:OmpA family protein [Flavobacterium sp. LS2P90]|uniref:OmpA family protein n=1 Tax=Flavobacterium xylosi TaxID=3230415 RepID=A0ABW6HTX2_9FLAO